MSSGYLLLVCLFGALAILIHLWQRSDWSELASKLSRGDFLALSDAVNGSHYSIRRDRLVRLRKRGFAFEDAMGGCRATLKGKIVVLLMRRRASEDALPPDGPNAGGSRT